ncbi:AraC family transcriptional regulator [Paenibacillus agri]|uniref:AraC family transcriptional regulator n=1 Tax=Paenibacillus agri TaxID=2744309 RepID=A0A850ESM8_9BACL|nr:AraC family transcriptional regulator [Paenibacillus agri]NUU61792.1 AraC family transcriptional regulator [Paenibacillus agri]
MNRLEDVFTDILTFNGIQALEIVMNGGGFYASMDSHTMLICLNGRATVEWGNDTCSLSPGEICILPPGQESKIIADEQEPFKGWRIQFDTYVLQEQNLLAKHNLVRYKWLRCENPQMLAGLCDRLHQVQLAERPSRYRGQADFYQLMALLQSSTARPSTEETLAEAIARVSNYIREHIDQELNRTELAQLAGLSPGYFSRAFQQLMGQSPSAFVMDLRIAKAKGLLLSGSGVRDTASRVGFDDEFYFSRRFKQQTGMSPLTYVNSRRRNIASVSEPIFGSLLALQLLPRAAAFYPNHKPDARMLRLHSDEQGIGQMWGENVAMLQGANPELIFCTDFLDAQAHHELAQIAPTVTVPWLTANWREQLTLIAEAADLEPEGQQWLSEYDRKAEIVRRKVRGSLGSATLNIWRIMDNEYRVYGDRNAGSVLYGDFQLTATHPLDEVDVYEIVTRKDLPAYDADALVIMVDPSPKAALEWRTLQRSKLLQNLTAAKNNRIFDIGTEKLLEYSAWSHDRALSYFAELLSRR